MPQITQQDYVKLFIEDLQEATHAEWAEVVRLHNAGVLMDAVIEDASGAQMRVVCDAVDTTNTVYVVKGRGIVEITEE